MVLDTTSKKIMGFAETTESGTITISALPLGKTYAFFLLMGHWENDASLPTLLNVGLTQCSLETAGSTTINIVMYPVVVNTVFSKDAETSEPVAGKTAYLSPGNWTVKWAIQRATAGTDGLDRLLAAQAIMEDAGYDVTPDYYKNGDLKIRKLRYIISGEKQEESGATTTKKDIGPYNISAYTGNIGDGGAVNFNVEYVPFNLTAVADWKIAYSGAQVTTAFDLDGGEVPIWIIRNGVNDLSSDGDTNFANFGKTDYANANANGAVRFVVGVEPGTPVPATPNPALLIKDGVFENPGAKSPEAYIGFTTEGYSDSADVYYAVVAYGAAAPGLSAYTGYLGALTADAYTAQKIRLENAVKAVQTNADVYVLLAKDGALSAPLVIQTDPTNGTPGWAWDGDGNGIAVTGITGVLTELPVGETKALTGTVTPGDATWRNIAWTVQDAGTTGASISRNGNTYALTATAAGTVTVTATVPHSGTEGNPDYTKDFDIIVNAAISVTLNTYAQTIPIPGTGTFGLTVTVTPFTRGQQVSWASSNTSVAKVSSATTSLNSKGTSSITVTGKSTSSTYITATIDGVTETCSVTVTEDWSGDIYGSPYKTWYVSSSGNDNRTGEGSGSALASMAAALEKIKAYYENNKSSWPQNSPAAISVSGTVGSSSTTNGFASIDNSDNEYPPILLTGTGTLTGSPSYQGPKVIVRASAGAVLIMENLKISAASQNTYNLGGVKLSNNSRFIMRSGGISGFNDGKNYGGAGGGLDVEGGSWAFMTGGTIKGNKSFSGGGVYIIESTFVMNGGTITENDAFHAGGVCIGSLGTFFMRGGEISKNTCTSDDANYTTYNMTANWSYGGGVGFSIRASGQESAFVKTGGTIYGSGTSANTVHVSNRGAAVGINAYSGSSLVKKIESTLGTSNNLYYNHNGTSFQLGYESGW
jgi:hypothetical protein